MPTIKSYTDIEQSKKLTNILPLESVDMWYHGHCSPLASERTYDDEPAAYHSMRPNWDLPCWSLAALLSILDFPSLTQNKENEWEVCVPNHKSDEYIEALADNPIDACVKMIEKLHELDLLQI